MPSWPVTSVQPGVALLSVKPTKCNSSTRLRESVLFPALYVARRAQIISAHAVFLQYSQLYFSRAIECISNCPTSIFSVCKIICNKFYFLCSLCSTCVVNNIWAGFSEVLINQPATIAKKCLQHQQQRPTQQPTAEPTQAQGPPPHPPFFSQSSNTFQVSSKSNV